MKALVISEPGRATLTDVAKPEPAADEVLLRVSAVGFCGTDLNIFRGQNPLVQYPRIPGHELSAIIAAKGREVPEEWPVGLKVTLHPYTNCGACSACRQGRFNCCRFNETLGVQREGALTEYVVAPWRKLYRSPKLSLAELALVEPLTVGFHAVDRARVTEDDTALVFGCGGVGLGAIAGAAFRRARVIAADIDDAKLSLARKCGAAETINTRVASLHERLQELTAGHGPDVVIEAAGLPETFRAAVEEVSFAGRVVYIGYVKQPVEYETKYFVQKELDIMGSRNATPADFKAVIALLESGQFPTGEVITKTVPLAEAAQALREWSDNPSAFTKIHVSL